MQPRLVPAFAVWAVLVGTAAAVAADLPVAIEPTAGGMRVRLGDQPFAEYLTRSGAKPVVWPLIGPTGAPVTRSYPMEKVEGEADDHVHQRSLWFTHGDVNGVSYWMEGQNAGTIVHREFVPPGAAARGDTLTTRNDWCEPGGKTVLTDERTPRFGGDEQKRWIDFDIVLTATAGPVRFGDTKEGTFGIRVAETMKVDARTGGAIVNSEGLRDGAAWGKRAAWVDYCGPVAGETVGIAVLNHPSSFRYPTFWHVRPYGLFAANPFGAREFTGDAQADGSHALPAGESLHLRYRVLLHRGDARAAGVAEAFAAYTRQ